MATVINVGKNGLTEQQKKRLSKEYNKAIRDSVLGDRELKKEIQKTLQQANRRIQNVRNKGYVSTALKSLELERGNKGYSMFSISGLDFNNAADWERAKYEYGRAISFLNNPTSSATGARRYTTQLAKDLQIPFNRASEILNRVSEIEVQDNGTISLMRYARVLDDLKASVSQDSFRDSLSAEQYADILETRLTEVINNQSTFGVDFLDTYINKRIREITTK